MSLESWSVRPYRPGDEHALAALWTASFGRTMTEAYWRWKCKGLPSDVENVGVAAGPDDRPIAQFVGIPCRAVVQGAERRVMIGADVVTAPAFRRRGVFTDTARRLFAAWRQAGVALVLGLANERWGSRAAALGYERYFKLHWLVRPLRPERILARRTGLAALARWRALGRLWNGVWDAAAPREPAVSVHPLASATPALDVIWERAAPRARFSLIRDRAWVAWRYFAPPVSPEAAYRVSLAERDGRPAGWAAYRVVRHTHGAHAQVADVFAPDDRPALAALVRDVVARAAAEDVDAVTALAVRGSATYRALRRAGFVFSPGAYRLEAVRLDPSIAAAALDDPGAWWLSGGDFDVV
jgi:hypothetical protein